MRSAIRTGRPDEAHSAAESMSGLYSYRAGVSPGSSAILAFTVLASLEEVLAVLQTAALLARSFKAQLSVEIPGKETLVVGPDDLYDTSPESFLPSIEAHFSSTPPGFVLEADFTAATFVSCGNISVRIRWGASRPPNQQS